jgi:hypothetical protein
MKVAAEWLAFVLRIREVPDSNLDPETDYDDRFFVVFLYDDRFFCGFPKSLQANVGTVGLP